MRKVLLHAIFAIIVFGMSSEGSYGESAKIMS